MTHYADPTICHPAECQSCGWVVSDADMLDDGDCSECVDAREPESEDDQ